MLLELITCLVANDLKWSKAGERKAGILIMPNANTNTVADQTHSSSQPISTTRLIEQLRDSNEVLASVSQGSDEDRFDRAKDVCAATRVVWGYYFSDFQVMGTCSQSISDQLLEAMSTASMLVKEAVNGLRDKTKADELANYVKSIDFRIDMLGRLHDGGVDWVDASYRKRLDGLDRS